MPLLECLFMLIFGHALADFVLQPDAMGYGKNRNDKIHDKEHSLFPVWWYWLTAHSLVHGIWLVIVDEERLGKCPAVGQGAHDHENVRPLRGAEIHCAEFDRAPFRRDEPRIHADERE